MSLRSVCCGVCMCIQTPVKFKYHKQLNTTPDRLRFVVLICIKGTCCVWCGCVLLVSGVSAAGECGCVLLVSVGVCCW